MYLNTMLAPSHHHSLAEASALTSLSSLCLISDTAGVSVPLAFWGEKRVVLGGKTVSGALKPFPWNLIPVPSEAQGEDSPGAFWVPLAISTALDRSVGKPRSAPTLKMIPGEGEKKPTNLFKGGKSNRTKEEICFINSETGDFNA